MCEGARVFTIAKEEVSSLIEEKLRSIDASLLAAETLAASAPADARERVARWLANGREQAETIRKNLGWQLAHLSQGPHLLSARELEQLRCDYQPFAAPVRLPGYLLHVDDESNLKAGICEGPVSYRNSPF